VTPDIAQFVQQAVADDQCSLAFAREVEVRLLSMHDKIKQLGAELADRDAQHRSVIDSPCPDEQHCTCVPVLRREIERLLDAIYQCGESPAEQRRQLDPVVYLRTRYVSVAEHNKACDSLRAEIERLQKLLDGPAFYWDERHLGTAYESIHEATACLHVGDVLPLRPIVEQPMIWVLVTEDEPQVFGSKEAAQAGGGEG